MDVVRLCFGVADVGMRIVADLGDDIGVLPMDLCGSAGVRAVMRYNCGGVMCRV